MPIWTDHFKELKRVAGNILPVDKLEISNTREEVKKTVTPPKPTEFPSLESELESGIETSLSTLDKRGILWSFKTQPVMVFGVRVNEVEDIDAREAFFRKVHLGPCCDALNDSDRSAWVASSSNVLSEWPGDESLEVCHHCLTGSNYKGYRSLTISRQKELRETFDFRDFVQWHAGDYFPDTEKGVWVSGSKLEPFAVGGNESAEICKHCQWPHSPDSPFLIRDAAQLDVEGPCCLCCSDHAGKVVIIEPSILLEAYIRRFEDWRDAYIRENKLSTIAAKTIKFSWSQISFHFPSHWQPLLAAFKQFEPADVYCTVDEGFAALAWPRLKRAVIFDHQSKDGFPGNWDVWSYSEVLSNL